MTSQLRKDKFIQQSKMLYGDKYLYEAVEYINTHTKVTIICKEHGEFQVRPVKHLAGQECPSCSKINRIKNITKFKSFNDVVNHCNHIHEYAYNYININTNSKYITTNDVIEIHCTIHGNFRQTINKHIYQRTGCPLCGTERSARSQTKSTQQFIQDARYIHGDLYSYDNVKYESAHQHVSITCTEHGDFLQTPANHILKEQGCPVCSSSSPEKIIHQWLIEHNIDFIHQAKFPDCVNQKNKQLIFDFFLTKQNVLIEYDGIYHFEPIVHNGDYDLAQAALVSQQLNDNIKNKYAQDHKFTLIRIPYDIKISLRDHLQLLVEDGLITSIN